MFYLNKNIELSASILQKMISAFRLNTEPKLKRYKNYYDGLQAIMRKEYADKSKPCNKSVINYCKNIVDSYTGYIATPSFISYRSEQDIEDIMQILRYNDYNAQDAELLRDALIYGVGAELMFIDEEGQTRFRTINPTQCFGVYDDSLTGDLTHFVRIYKLSEWDDSDTYCVDVYGANTIKHYTMQGYNGSLSLVGEEAHYFSQCPANVFYLQDEKSIFDCILSLQDSANELLSAEIDDYAAFCDAYLVIQGGEIDADTVAEMKTNRVIQLPYENANAYWLTKQANDTQIENIMKRLQESIYRISQCVDFSSETFTGGVSSGVAIRFKLSGMETRAGKIEAEMKKALQRRIEIICGIASLKLGEEVFRDVEIDFKRNIPEDESALVNLVNGLKGTVSDGTLLGLLPFVGDVNAELEALEAQKASNMELYGFGAPAAAEDEDEEEQE